MKNFPFEKTKKEESKRVYRALHSPPRAVVSAICESRCGALLHSIRRRIKEPSIVVAWRAGLLFY